MCTAKAMHVTGERARTSNSWYSTKFKPIWFWFFFGIQKTYLTTCKQEIIRKNYPAPKPDIRFHSFFTRKASKNSEGVPKSVASFAERCHICFYLVSDSVIHSLPDFSVFHFNFFRMI